MGLSDMAPNLAGNASVDQSRSMYLCELALDMCHQVLKPGGSFVIKVFQGEGFVEFMNALKQSFTTIKTRKPDSSRSRSREVYLEKKTKKKNKEQKRKRKSKRKRKKNRTKKRKKKYK